jgi:hypothetical protein
MAKAAYKPTQMLREDPLAALKRATEERIADAGQFTGEEISPSHPKELSQSIGRAVKAPDDNTEQLRHMNTVPSIAPVKPLARSLTPSRNTVYLYPEDLTKLRMLSGYASTNHGIRTNDSVIVRAALSLVEPDIRFMHALEEAMQSDRRKSKP